MRNNQIDRNIFSTPKPSSFTILQKYSLSQMSNCRMFKSSSQSDFNSVSMHNIIF